MAMTETTAANFTVKITMNDRGNPYLTDADFYDRFDRYRRIHPGRSEWSRSEYV